MRKDLLKERKKTQEQMKQLDEKRIRTWWENEGFNEMISAILYNHKNWKFSYSYSRELDKQAIKFVKAEIGIKLRRTFDCDLCVKINRRMIRKAQRYMDKMKEEE